MEIKVGHRYLVLPIKTENDAVRMVFYLGGEPVYELNCSISEKEPDFHAYVDLFRYMGETLTVETVPETEFTQVWSDEMDIEGLYREKNRPMAHFTPKNGWHNDPNGLVYYEGRYHLFFQHNPCSPGWGNMHWGHAVSSDLVHWEELPEAIFPDRRGAAFSGSGICDVKNLTGLGTKERPPMLLYYAAAAECVSIRESNYNTQCLVYSTDGGETFEKYSENPVIPPLLLYSRDPKVVWVDELSCYVLAVSYDVSVYRLFRSDDLLHFEFFCDVNLPGVDECPDFYPLDCDGERYWVFTGGNNGYVVGRFTSDGFDVIQDVRQKEYGQSACYAAQSFSDMPDGRVVRVPWNPLCMPGEKFQSQMGLPREVKLFKDPDGEFRVSELPTSESEALRDESLELLGGCEMTPGRRPLDLEISCDYIPGRVISMRVFGNDLVIDTDKNTLTCRGQEMPVSHDGKKIDVRAFFDLCSAEFFTDGGRHSMTRDFEYSEPTVTLDCGGYPASAFRMWKCKNIWE